MVKMYCFLNEYFDFVNTTVNQCIFITRINVMSIIIFLKNINVPLHTKLLYYRHSGTRLQMPLLCLYNLCFGR